MTGLEIAAADALPRPVLAFLADDNWPGKLWDKDSAARGWTENFRAGLNRNAKFFKWEDDPKLPTRSLWGEDYRKPSSIYPYRLGDLERENLDAADDVLRVLRGGSFDDFASALRAALRFRLSPENRSDDIGFRVVSSRARP
jgi:formylglycine-generating enzyme required for sulfatase activity